MKAMILAAGLGTRLYPLTKEIPKPMLPIADIPLIGHQIKWMKENGIEEIMVNLHYLPGKIKEYLGDGSKFNVKIHYSLEEELLGTSGAIRKVKNFFNKRFLVFYGDNFTNLKLDQMKRNHINKKSLITILTREKDINERFSNVIIFNKDQQITKFIEKPSKDQCKGVKRNTANCGIYICEPSILDLIPKKSDFSRDIFPKIIELGGLYAFEKTDKTYWCEIGRVEKYWKFKDEIESNKLFVFPKE